jgi:hypothetical protein
LNRLEKSKARADASNKLTPAFGFFRAQHGRGRAERWRCFGLSTALSRAEPFLSGVGSAWQSHNCFNSASAVLCFYDLAQVTLADTGLKAGVYVLAKGGRPPKQAHHNLGTGIVGLIRCRACDTGHGLPSLLALADFPEPTHARLKAVLGVVVIFNAYVLGRVLAFGNGATASSEGKANH